MQSAERRWWIKWSVALLVAVALTALAARMAYFPGDVALARLVQTVTPSDPGWAQAITNTARVPSNYLLLGLSVALSWWLAGWRAALLAVAAFALLSLLGAPLQNAIGRPRPSAALVRLAGSSSGFSFPSIFALTYVSTFGYLATLTYRQTAPARRVVFLFSVLALIIGGAARVALGAHWPSDVVVAYLIGLVWTTLLVKLAVQNRER